MKPVAFLGLGIMGLPMARRLAAAGIPLRVWNRTLHRSREFDALSNVTLAPTAAEAVRTADMVIIMLSTGAVVDDTLFTPDAQGQTVVDNLEASALVIVMSSIPVETARSQARRLQSRNLRYIDAPVSGGERGAIAASLTIMVGGSPADVDSAAPILRHFGSIVRVGPVGCGQLAKLANQLIVGVTIGAVAEALLLAGAGGADSKAVAQALQGGFADSRVLRQHGQNMIERSFMPGAHLATQLKDLETARAQARKDGLSLPFLELSETLFRSAFAHGYDRLDHSALFLELEQSSKAPPLFDTSLHAQAAAPPHESAADPRLEKSLSACRTNDAPHSDSIKKDFRRSWRKST